VTDRAAPELARRLALSLVRPVQRPTVPAGQLSLSVMNLPPRESRVATSLTPAKAGVTAGVWVVEVWVVEVGAGAGELGAGEDELGAGGSAAVVKVWSAPLVTPPALVATSR